MILGLTVACCLSLLAFPVACCLLPHAFFCLSADGPLVKLDVRLRQPMFGGPGVDAHEQDEGDAEGRPEDVFQRFHGVLPLRCILFSQGIEKVNSCRGRGQQAVEDALLPALAEVRPPAVSFCRPNGHISHLLSIDGHQKANVSRKSLFWTESANSVPLFPIFCFRSTEWLISSVKFASSCLTWTAR